MARINLAPPETLAPEAQARWLTVVAALGTRAVDPDVLATYCQVWVRWRQAEDGIAKTGVLIKRSKGGPGPSPLLAIARQAAAEVRALERKLGLDAPPETEDDSLITRRELAQALGVHMMTVTKWERDGMPVAQRGSKGRPSFYREVEVRAWRQAREDAARAPDGQFDVAQERAKKERWQALLAEQLYLMREKKLLPVEDVERAWMAEIAGARAIILAAYTAAADRVYRAAVTDGLVGVERELKEIALIVLRELAHEAKVAAA